MSSANTPKEIKVAYPSDFNGDKTKARLFLAQCKMYLTLNSAIFDTDTKKIAFVLSFCKEGTAAAFAENALNEAITKNATKPDFGTWADFEKKFTNWFVSADVRGDAQSELSRLRMTGTAEEYVAQFQILAERAGLKEYEALKLMFLKGLHQPLLDKLYAQADLPTKIEDWYEKTIRLDNNWRRFRNMVGPRTPFRASQRTSINRLSDEEAMKYRKEGRCFRCGKTGHISRNCDKRNNNNNKGKMPQGSSDRNIRAITETPDQVKPPALDDTVAKIRALFSGMTDNDKESILDRLEEQGF